MAESPTSNSPSHEPLHPLSPATPSTPAAAPTLDSRVHLSEDAPASPADADASAGKEEEEKNRAEEALQQDGLDESRTAMASEGYPPGVNPGTEASSPQEEVGAESTAASAPARKERKKNERGAARDARKERKSAALAALRTPAAQAAAPSPSPSTTSLAGDAAPPTAAVDVNSSSPSRPPTPPSPSRTANTFRPANPPAPSVSKGSTASSDAPAPAEDPPSPIASVDPVAQAKPAAHTPAPSAPTPAPAASFAAAAASTASAAPTARAALAKGQTTRLGGSLPAKRPPLGSRSTAPAQARAAKGASSPGVKVGGARGAKKRTGGMKPQVWVPDGRVVVGNQSFEPNSGEAVNIVMPLRHSCGANSKPAERLLNTYRPPSSPPRNIKRPKLRTLRPNPRIPPTTEAVSRARGSDNPQRSSRTPAPPPRIAPSTLTSSAPAQFYKKKKKPAHTRQHKLRAGSGGCSASGMSGAKGAPRGPGASQSPSRAGEQEDRAGETVPKAAAQGSSGEAQRRAATNGVKTVKRGQDGSGGAARAKKVENAHTSSRSHARTKGAQAKPDTPAAPPSSRQQRSDDGARAPHAPTKPVVASDEPVATDQPDSPSPTATAAPDTPDPRVAPPVTGNLSLPTVPSRAEEATPPPPPGSAEPAGSSTEAQQSATPPPPQPAPAPPSTREEMLEHTVEVVAAKLAKDAARRGPRRWWHAVGRSRASPQSHAYARRVRTLRALERAQVFELWRDAMKKKVEEDEQAEREWARRRRSAMSGRVTVTHGARRIATLTHHDDMTTATLKVEVRRTTGIPLSKQHIFYEGNELRNAHTLARARVPPGAVLRLEAPPAPLLAVDRGGQQVKLAVESSAIVDDIGTALSRYCAPLGAYPLSLGGKTLLGGRSIASFGYGPRNVVKIAGTFLPTFPLPVKLATGDKITLMVNTFDSVQVIKSKIGAETGVQPRELDLFVGDIKLDEKKSVADVGLNAKSNVGVVQHNLLQIYIKNLAGKLIPVEIDSGDTVTDVKAIIEEKEGVPRAEQRLIYAGHQLEDSTALATFDFPPGATLDLVLRLRGGVKRASGDRSDDGSDTSSGPARQPLYTPQQPPNPASVLGYIPTGSALSSSAFPPKATAPPIVVSSSAARAEQRRRESGGEGYEPMMEDGRVEEWLCAGADRKKDVFTSSSVDDCANLPGPFWIRKNADGKSELLSAIMPDEAGRSKDVEMLGLRFVQQLGEDPQAGTFSDRHVLRMNDYADRAIIPLYRSSVSYIQKIYVFNLLLPWAKRRLNNSDCSRIHFYFVRSEAHKVVPGLKAGNLHLHSLLAKELASLPPDPNRPPYDPSLPFYTWTIVDVAGSPYVLNHYKRRVYTDYRYRRVTVLDGSCNPSDAGEATASAAGGRHDAGAVSTESAAQVTMPMSEAADLFVKLKRLAVLKSRAGSFLAPSAPDVHEDVLSAEQLEKRFGPFEVQLSTAEIARLRSRLVQEERATRVAALYSSSTPSSSESKVTSSSAQLPSSGYAPQLGSRRWSSLELGPAWVARASTVAVADAKVRRSLQAQLPPPGTKVTIFCEHCIKYFTFVVPSSPSSSSRAFTLKFNHPEPRSATCRSRLTAGSASRWFDKTATARHGLQVLDLQTKKYVTTLQLGNKRFNSGSIVVQWYQTLTENIIGDKAFHTSFSQFLAERPNHWGQPFWATLVRTEARTTLHVMLARQLGPEIMFGESRTIGCGGLVILANRPSALYTHVVHGRVTTSEDPPDPPIPDNLKNKILDVRVQQGQLPRFLEDDEPLEPEEEDFDVE